MKMLAGSFGPTASEYAKSGGASYANWYTQAKSQAAAVDNTPVDTDPRDGFVEFKSSSSEGESVRTLVQLWDNNNQASVRFVSGTLSEESKETHTLYTQKDRFIEIHGDDRRGIAKVYDRLNQSVEQSNEQYSNYLVQDQQDRTVVVTPADGQIVADNVRDANLLYDSNWSLAEFQARKADLGI